MREPLVSISCITYNHEPFIRQCLDGFLMQKCDFEYEILIHDDASTDGTQDIIKEYQDKYPEIVKPIFQIENQLSKGVNGINRTFNFPRAKGKYIALCDGDDYWIDPLKLQKQVEFLELHSEYGLIHSDSHFLYEAENKWKYNSNKDLSNTVKVQSKKELFQRIISGDYKVRTSTALFRRNLLNQIEKNNFRFSMGDTPLWLDLSQLTQFKYIDEPHSVYRINKGSVSNPSSKLKRFRFILSMAEMRVFYTIKYNYAIPLNLKIRYNNALINYLYLEPDFSPLYSLIEPTLLEKSIFNIKYLPGRRVLIVIHKIKNKITNFVSKHKWFNDK